jgi:hypothetical protein
LATIRIHRDKSDILITFHLPERQGEETLEQFKSILKSCVIHDWNLFGE